MEKNFFKIITVFIVMLLCIDNVKAQVGYAELTGEGNNKTLTFKSGASIPDGAIELNSGNVKPSWYAESKNITTVVFEPSFASVRPTSCYWWFTGMENLTSISGMKNYLNTESVTDMRCMFNNCFALRSLDLSGFNTGNVTDMGLMFSGCHSLSSLDVSSFNTGNVTDMICMFTNCSMLSSLDISGFNTENVTSMAQMFGGCHSLSSLDVSSFNTGNVTDMGYMFYNCMRLISLDVSGFNTENVTNMDHMFFGCKLLTSLDLSSFKTENVTNMMSMFYGCNSLTNLDVSGFKTEKVTEMGGMFNNCSGLTSLDVSGFKTDNVTYMHSMFYGCSGLTNLDVSGFKTDNVTDMDRIFFGCASLANLDLSGFNTENLTTMNEMFKGCSGLTSLDVSGFNTEKVTNMNSMFDGCTSLTNLDLSGFDTENVWDMSYMFNGCNSLTYLDLSGFNTENLITMSYMFKDCSGLTTILVSDIWNTEKDLGSYQMFYGCNSLVGGAGTGFNESYIDKTYARVDGGTSSPGYLTYKGPYAEISSDGKTLAFKYGIKPDGAYSLNTIEMPDWYTDETRTNITKVVFDKSFKDARPTTCRSWFQGFENLTEIVGMKEYLNTERVTNMEALFAWCSKLTTIDVSGFNTEKVNNMNWMFRDCENLTSLDLSGFKTDIVTDLSAMFFNCQKLITLDLSAFNTKNVESMGFMFAGCSNLTTILISEKWKADEVETDEYMFNNCPELIGNYGATVGDIVGKTKANAGKDGYLTEGDYKIFYKWADDETGKYYAYTPSAFAFSTTNSVKINNPDDKLGHTFAYWTGTKITGLVDGVTSSDVTIAATEVGNRIYTAHWTINSFTASFYYDETSFISSLSVVYGSTLAPVDSPEKPQNRFLHWAVTKGGETSEVDFETFTMPAGDVNFYAQWEEKQTPPAIQAADGLVYNFAEQTLVAFESPLPEEITFSYKVDGGEYSEALPVGKDAKEYVVWYKSDETENYKPVSESSVAVTISPRPVTPDITLSQTVYIYDGEEKFPEILSVTFEGADLSSDYNEPVYNNNRNVGEATVTITSKTGSNYTFTQSVNFVIVADPFENFFDDTKWYNTDIALKTPENNYGWTLYVPNYIDNTVTKEGENNVKCQILNETDDIIAEESYLIKIDKTAPEIFALADGHNVENSKKYFLRSGAEFSAAAKDNLSGVETLEYSWDNEIFKQYDGKITLPYGKNTVYLRSKDVAGNQSETLKADFSVFEDSKFVLNNSDEITSDTIFYSSKKIHDISFEIDLNGNTIGSVVDSAGNPLNFSVTGGVIKIDKNFLETLLPGINRLSVRINPLGDAGAWSQAFAGFDTQTMRINLDVRYAVASKEYSFVLQSDPAVKAFCQGDDVVITLVFDEKYSDVDYFSIETLGIDRGNPDEEIKFRIPVGALSGGNEKLPVKFFKDGYEFDDVLVFPSDYPLERNIKVYDDVLALDNSDGQFTDGKYKWYMDNVELSGVNTQFLDLTKYMTDGQRHVFFASVENVDGDRFRVCPDDSFVIEPFLKKKVAAVKTYPNPAVSSQPVYIELKNFAVEDFSETEILIYNQLGGLVQKVSEVGERTAVVLPSGFYSGVVVLRGQKVLNFKIVVE